jgi:CRP-like cAMP-binding protein
MPDSTAAELTPEVLAQIDAFRVLTRDEREQIMDFCLGQSYDMGRHIISYQDVSRDVFFIASGRAQAINYASSGHLIILQDLEAGQMFGELSAIDGEPRSAHVVTVTESFIVSMKYDNFLRILELYPPVIDVTMKRLTGMVRLLGKRVYDRDTLPATQRVCAELLRLAYPDPQRQGQEIISPLPTRAKIAHHIGTSRETVSREIASLRKAGIVKQPDKETLLICDVKRLLQLIRRAQKPRKAPSGRKSRRKKSSDQK